MSCSVLSRPEVRVPVWGSAFKIIEAPMSYMNKLLNTHGRWYDIISSSPVSGRDLSDAFDPLWYGLKKFNVTEMKLGAAGYAGKLQILAGYLFDRKITILATAGQVIAYPISCAFTPITAIADIFAGVMQATVRTYQGASKEEIQSILHKKVIAAPTQQLAYSLNNFVVLGPIFLEVAKYAAIGAAVVSLYASVIGIGVSLSAGLPLSKGIVVVAKIVPKVVASTAISIAKKSASESIIIYSFLMGDTLYRDAQGMVGKLPKFLIPDGYNIFIENGALDEFGDNAFDPEGDYAEYKKQANNSRENSNELPINEKRPYSLRFKQSIESDLNKITNKDPSFQKLRTWFEAGKKPYTLFEFESQNQVDESKLKQSYRKLVLKYHPDKCADASRTEAEILFKMVNTAREDIEERILKK